MRVTFKMSSGSSTTKHNEKYLKTVLTKILRTDVLDSFNKDNPFSNVLQCKEILQDQSCKDLQQRADVCQSGECPLTERHCFRGDKYERTSLCLF